MRKVIFLMVCTIAIINLKAQVALPVAATGNDLKDGTTANNAAVASTATAGFKLSINGATIYYGTGVNTVTSPTIYLRNLTASTGRIYALNSDDTGLFTISEATGTTSPLTLTSRFVINSTGNVGIGTATPAYKLDVTGTGRFTGDILVNGATMGKGSGNISTNQVFGANSLKLNTTGANNNVFGGNSLTNNTDGQDNNAFGSFILQSNITGGGNNSFGNYSLYSNTSGEGNSAFGDGALYNNTTGSSNSVIGINALFYNAIGSENIALGQNSGAPATGADNTNSNKSIFIGAYTKSLTVNQTNEIVIGDSAIGNGSNTVTLGNDAITKTVLKGTANLKSYGTGSNIGTAAYALQVDASGNLIEGSLAGGTAGWGLTGNAGTNSTTNFIGTIDSTDVVFKRFNTRSGLLAQTNTSFGYSALSASSTGLYNLAIGSYALAVNTSGANNTAIGPYSMYSNTTGSRNIGLGISSLYYNTTGSDNVALGLNALTANTTGTGNTGVGSLALGSTTTGVSNTAIGYWAMRFNTTGNDNIAIGVTAMRFNTTGSQNTVIGRQSSYQNISGSGLVSIGYMAGYNSLTGNNTAIGYQAGYSSTGGGNVMLGYQAGYSETGSNKLYIANSSTATPLIYGDFTSGNVGIGTNQINDTAYKLFVEKGIHTRKIKVDATAWADYVFDKDYKLPTLPEVDKYIQQNKHLPGVQSTAEVEKNGIDLGENQATLLKKVEELTLYLIELKKDNETLKLRLEKLESSNNSEKAFSK
jgi:hypothetical protein